MWTRAKKGKEEKYTPSDHISLNVLMEEELIWKKPGVMVTGDMEAD